MTEEYFLIKQSRICGEVVPQGSKNAALPLIAACVECRGRYVLRNVPDIEDVKTLIKIFSNYGVKFTFRNNELSIDSRELRSSVESSEEEEKLRASSYLIGAIIPSNKRLVLSPPGGCKLGDRPLDIHFDVCRSLGVTVRIEDKLYFEWDQEGSRKINLRFPSVGATINAIMLAASLEKETLIVNAAPEPEVDEVISFYRLTGVKIEREGESILIFGKENKKEIVYAVPFDRIVCGDLMLLAAATKGELLIKGVDFQQEAALIGKFSLTPCQIRYYYDRIYIRNSGRVCGNVITAPYPYFPTDLQAQFAAASVGSGGSCRICEHVFGSRFAYFEELEKMGAKGKIDGNELTLERSALTGATVTAKDLRSGMALTIAGFAARGYTKVYGLRYLDRGYENLVRVLTSINGDIKRIE
ncbi:MAG: UDP-N-acetylglucosamine 1-carboxyvinyltransferase [Clostridia bacterium]|nr:UDP-N-acetylglucosamine 1-carboxyvinyltransferase [Clostridia bacterium]